MKPGRLTSRRLLDAIVVAVAIAAAAWVAGCTAMYPQTAAQNYAPTYYESSYNSLSPGQKMQLEDHLAKQSNQAWRTTAQVAGSLGHLMQGTGALIRAIRYHPPRRR
jgi:hypothetical protein